MKYIIENPLPTDGHPKIILNGLKLMSIEFEKLKLIDSLNFIPMPLSKFPKTFGFNEMHKGYFRICLTFLTIKIKYLMS